MQIFRCLLILVLLAAPALAEEPPRTFEMDPVVVTGSWTPVKLSDSPANVSVVRPQEIRRRRPLDAAEAVAPVPSVFVRRSGPVGALSTFSVRGSTSTEALVMLDGRPLNQPGVATADLAPVPAGILEQAEVLRGPYSALYGPYASAGVLRLTTRKARPEDGPGGLQLLAGGLGTSDFAGDFHLDLGGAPSSGARPGTPGRPLRASGARRLLLAPEVRRSLGSRPNSESTLTSGFARFDADLGERRSLALSGGFQSAYVGAPGPRPPAGVALRTATQSALGDGEVSSLVDHQIDRNAFLDGRLDWDGFQAHLYASSWRPRFHFEYLDFLGSRHLGDATSYQTQRGVELRYTGEHGEGSAVTVGALLEDSRLESTSSDLDTVLQTTTFSDFQAARQMQSLYLEENLKLGPVTASLGARVDRPSDFPEVLSPRASLLWKAAPFLHLRGGWGKGYRPPTLFELHLPATAFSSGNPALRPQTSTSTEGGLEALLGDQARLRFTAFREDARDKIVFAPVGPLGPFGPLFIPANLDRFRKVGWELELTVEPTPGLTLRGAHSRIDAVQVNQELVDAAGNVLVPVERPAAQVPGSLSSMEVAWRNPDGPSIVVNGRWVGEMVNYYANFDQFPVVTQDVKRLPPSSVFDLVVSHPLRWGDVEGDVFLKVTNLFDQPYSLTFGNSIDDQNFPMPGRTLFFGFSPRFD